MFEEIMSIATVIVFLLLAIAIIWKGVCVVPQSTEFVVERFGKYRRSLSPGLNIIVPFLDNIAHKVSIIERSLPQFRINVITKDNVELELMTTVFYRITDSAKAVYRIHNLNDSLSTAATSIVRSAAGTIDLDQLQSYRTSMNEEISQNLGTAAEVWGIEITRTEITDVIIDEQTRDAQRQQLNAERQRRAQIAKAEGDKRHIELASEGQLYEAKKKAEAIKIKAEAEAFAVRQKAEAEADQTKMLAEAIKNHGQPAVDFEIRKQQVEAVSKLASAGNSKIVVLPAEVVGVLGAVEAFKQIARPHEEDKG